MGIGWHGRTLSLACTALAHETRQANLVAGMKWLLGTYSGRFNRKHKRFGDVFSGRDKSLVGNERKRLPILRTDTLSAPNLDIGCIAGWFDERPR